MTSNIARWMQMKRFEQNQIAEIQRAEMAWWKGRICTNRTDYNRHDWYRAGLPLIEQFNRQIGPFWERNKTDDERHFETKSFESAIFKKWAPIMSNLDQPEIDSIHEADWEIWQNGPAIITRAQGHAGKSEEMRKALSR